MNLLSYPDPRVYPLLDPINHPSNNCHDLPLVRYPHRALCFSMNWDRFNEPEDGHLWTRVDSLGRLAIPSELD